MSNSPSSSSIPCPSSKSSLSSLPVELLRQIIELSVPSYYHPLIYSQRQRTLRKLCLTSRLFREIAQPILERLDRHRLLREGDSVEQIASARAPRTNVLAISVEVEMPLERMNSLLLAYGQLKELHIDGNLSGFQEIDASLLATLPCAFHPLKSPQNLALISAPISQTLVGLESLNLRRTRLIFVSPRSFLTLKDLTLSDCAGDLDALFAQPSFLPSLKVLALEDRRRLHNPIHDTALLSRLYLFIGDSESLKEEVLKAHGDKVLTAYRFKRYVPVGSQHPQARHLRLQVSSVDLETADDIEDLNETLNEIRGFLDASGTSLKTLFLDHGLRDALRPFRFTQVTYDKLIELCEERGIEVILEEQAVLDSADSAITPELLRWMDRRQEKAKISLDAESEMETR